MVYGQSWEPCVGYKAAPLVEGAGFPRGCGGDSGQPWMLRVGTLAVWMEGSWGWGYPVYEGGHHPDTSVLLRFVRVCGAKSGRCCCGNNMSTVESSLHPK